MPEGLSPAEVSKEIAEHKERSAEAEARSESEAPSRHDRRLSIAEALLLSLVAVLAAYSGYAAAKWGTESSIQLAKASAQRTKANRFDNDAIVTRTLDSVSFNAWFTAFSAGNKKAETLAQKRLRPGYRPAPQPRNFVADAFHHGREALQLGAPLPHCDDPFLLGRSAQQGLFGKGFIEITHDRRHLTDGSAILQHQSRHYPTRIDRSIGIRVLLAVAEVDSDERNLQAFLDKENPHAPRIRRRS